MPRPMLLQVGRDGLTFSIQGPGVTVGLWFLLKAQCLAPRAYHPSSIPFIGKVGDYEHRGERKTEEKQSNRLISFKAG